MCITVDTRCTCPCGLRLTTTTWEVLSHGYLSCGFMPVRIAFPTLAACLLGPTTAVPLHIIVQSFKDYVSSVDRSTVHETLTFKGDSYPSELAM